MSDRLHKIIKDLLPGEALVLRRTEGGVKVSTTAETHRGTETTGTVEVALHQCDGDGLVDPLLVVVGSRIWGLRS